MFDDDLDPRTKKKVLKSLDNYSVSELEEYITNLKNEITRAESEIARKKAHKDAVSSLFGSKTS